MLIEFPQPVRMIETTIQGFQTRCPSRLALLVLLCLFCRPAAAQPPEQNSYHPLGDPKQWNVQISPFLWLPSVSGTVSVPRFTKDYSASQIDLLKQLRGAVMFRGEVSKGKVFVAPTYLFFKLKSESVLRYDGNGDPATVVVPALGMHILEVDAGARLPVGSKLIFDPYLGFRYNHFKTTMDIDGKFRDTAGTVIVNFADPVLGLRLHYYVLPRLPITVKADIGGWGYESRISWSAGMQIGYTVSPTIDLLAGFTAYGLEYEQFRSGEPDFRLKNILYGLNLGATVYFPKRHRDPALFKKQKKGKTESVPENGYPQ